MSDFAILYPVFCQVALTFLLLYATGRVRLAAISRGEVKVKDIALGQNAWPERPTRFANAYNSQFQLPVLFYALSFFAQLMGQVDTMMLVLAWGFVASRLVHAGIYITSNNIRHRFVAFVAGFAILAAMWGLFAFLILAAGVE